MIDYIKDLFRFLFDLISHNLEGERDIDYSKHTGLGAKGHKGHKQNIKKENDG